MARNITLSELKKEGVITYNYTDKSQITFKLSIFEIGWIVTIHVFAPDGAGLYNNSTSAPDYKSAKNMFDETKKRIDNEDDSIHRTFANKVGINYAEVKDRVETWCKENKRVFTLGDCQNIASHYPNRNKAFDYAYTAACAIENTDFGRYNNFRVDFTKR